MQNRRGAAAVLLGTATGLISACASTTTTGGYSDVPPPYRSAYDQAAAPRPSFEFENVPPPAAIAALGYVRQSRGQQEQQRTAELLAEYQRANNVSSYSPGLQTATYTTAVSSAPVAYTDSTTNAYAQTDYYAGDHYTGASIPPMPTSARPGECFALVRTPEQYRSVQREYVARPGYDRVEVQPARYETSMREYVSHEAYERLEIIPATFRTVTEQVEVSPPSVRYLTSEPSYETVTERILETPARQVWKKGRGPIQRVDNATGEIMCLVEEPAVYRTVTRRVLKNQPQVREVQVPGEYRTVSRRVIDRPAEVRRVTVPEQRSRMQVQTLVQPARYDTVRVPDQMGSVTVRELTAPATLEWRPVLCETNMSGDVVRRLQDSLRSAGYDPGPSDGRIGARTMAALNAYQRARGLPEDRYLNLDTLRSLSINY